MEELKSLEQIEKPGLWFVYSMQPTLELCRYIYQLAVETGLHLTVYSSASEEEIQKYYNDIIFSKFKIIPEEDLANTGTTEEDTANTGTTE